MSGARRSFARLPRERRVQDILAAARALFCENGYEAASMAAIAERAGVVEGTIYNFFSTKRELLIQVLASWYEGMLDDDRTRLAGITGLRSRLRYIIWRHVRTIAEEPTLCRLFFREVRTNEDYPSSPLFGLNRTYTEFASQVLREGVASGELRPDLPIGLTRDAIYGAIEHRTWRHVTAGGGLPVDAIADELTDLILDGARRRAPIEALDAVAGRLDRIAGRMESLGARP